MPFLFHALLPPTSASFTLEEFASMKQELYHIGTKDYGIEILCENVFYKDDVLFLLVSL